MTTQHIPLHVFQVLEEEYGNLYGEIPPTEVTEVWMPARDDEDTAARPDVAELNGVRLRAVEAARDWRFRRGHLLDPTRLAVELLRKSEPESRAEVLAEQPGHLYEEWAKHNLRAYLRGQMNEAVLLKLAAAQQTETTTPEELLATEADLCAELNRLLEDPALYDAERFPKGWMTPMVEGLAGLHASDGALEGEDLAQLNRLLIESAFPGYLERIHHIRVAAVYQRFHKRAPTALSLSGGGIRSGTFALGLLQGMARHDLLKQFDYLSTVSGGGYVGSWLTAWLHRHPEGLKGVTRELANRAPVSKVDPDPRPIRYLRDYSSFLTPKVGALTADTWAFVAIYLRNLLLNWAVLLPLLVAVLMVPRLHLAVTLLQPVEERDPAVVSLRAEAAAEQGRLLEEVPAPMRRVYEVRTLGEFIGGEDEDKNQFTLYPRHGLLLVGFLLGAWALGYVGFNRPGVRETLRKRSRFWRERSDQRAFLRYCLLPLVVSAALLTTYWAWKQETSSLPPSILHFLGCGLLFGFCGWLIASLVLRRLRHPQEIGGAEFFSILAAGGVGGLLFWLTSLLPIGDPVIGYGVRIHGDRVVSRPLAWTDWTDWTWFDWKTELYVCLAVPTFLLVFWAGATLFVGTTSYSRKINDEDREWWARFGAWLLIATLAWLALTGTVIYGPLALLEFPRLLTAVGGLSGLVAVLVGRSTLIRRPEEGSAEPASSSANLAKGLLRAALPLLGLIFLGVLVAAVSLSTSGLTRGLAMQAGSFSQNLPEASRALFTEALTNVPVTAPYSGFGRERAGALPPADSYLSYITPVVPTPTAADAGEAENSATIYTGAQIVHLNVLHHTSFIFQLVVALIALGAGLLLSRLINLNYFSLHGGYRNRLIRAFLGASRPPGQRTPNPFTGFDPADNLHMHELRPTLLDEDDFIDPTGLAEALRDHTHPISRYLNERGLLSNVLSQNDTTPSPRLLTALRTDLNSVIESENSLDQLAQEHLNTEHARRIRRAIMEEMRARGAGGNGLGQDAARNQEARSDKSRPDEPTRDEYRILLNRLILEASYPRMLRPYNHPPPPYRMMHVVNTALNLVGGEKLAWQQRKAEPFSISPLHAGCFRLGYRRSRVYGGKDTGGISIGTAAAISGAAASSNMGYYTTSPIMSLLLTLFNVRLGWWLGNPGPAGQKTYQLSGPKFSISPIAYEAFGMTNDTYEYVYLTDGGHFENLALYEMILRRCRFIIVSDGAEDASYRFGDLGNAVRKIRIDLGVPIEFPCVDIYGWDTARERGSKGMYWAVGKIRYSYVDNVAALKAGADGSAAAWPKTTPAAAEDGVLLYIKPALYGDEPRDVLEYRESFPAFPHQSTGDQFFDEPQFESYRALGSYIMDQLCGSGYEPLTIPQLIDRARKSLNSRCMAEFARDENKHFLEWLDCLAGTAKDKGPTDAASMVTESSGERRAGGD
jgi:hypothetical protein